MKISISFLAGLVLFMTGIVANIGKLPANDTEGIGIIYSLIGLTIVAIMVSLCVMLGSSNRVVRIRPSARAIRIAVLPIGLLLLQLASLVRTGFFQSVVTMASLYSLALTTLMILIYAGVGYILASRTKMEAYWRYLGWSIVAYGAAGVVLALLGMQSIVSGGGNVALLPSLFGFDVVRESLPMFSGLNSTGTVLGAGVAALISLSSRMRYLLIVSMLIAMALVDARASFFSLAFAIMITVAATKSLGMILAAFGIAMVGGVVMMDFGALVESVSRTPGDFSTSRVELWGIAIGKLSEWELMHMVGYGAFGQTVSGLSREFSGFFSDEVYVVATLHNCALQMVFDIGYIGLTWWGASWFVLLRWAWIWFAKTRTDEARFAFMITVYFFAIGLFQSSCGYSENDSLFIFVALFAGTVLSILSGSYDGRLFDRHGSVHLYNERTRRKGFAE